MHANHSGTKKHRRRRSRRERVILALCIFLFAGMAVVGFVRSYVRPPDLPDSAEDPAADGTEDGGGDQDTDAPPPRERKKSYYTVLVSGIDDDNGGSDTNILLSVDAENSVINAVSVPRDTLLNVDWNVRKFNASYNVGGIDRMKTELSRLLGIPVDFYISVDLDGFVELVDEIGGVYFDVPVDMNYDDPTQNLHIHIDKGYQWLDGEHAVKVVRWRQNNDGTGYPDADIGRIATQQAFLTAVAQQMLDSLSISTIKAYADIFIEYVDTDLTVGNLAWIGQVALTCGMENIHFYTLPGEGGYVYGGSYYILHPEETLDLINASFNPYDQDISLEETDIPVP